MADNQCVGIKNDGHRCGNRKRVDLGNGQRCGTHHAQVARVGLPHVIWDDLWRKHAGERRDLMNRYAALHDAANAEFDFEQHMANKRRELADLHIRQNAERAAMRDQILREHNVDMMAVQPAAEGEAAFQARIEDMRARIVAHNLAQRVRVAAAGGGGGELARFAQDAQNVHTQRMVRQTKEIVDRITAIPVPEGYRWNTRTTSKTIGEIISACELSPHAACQMLTKYSNRESIYELGQGVYGKVLDGVWQFIKAHAEKDSLVKILKQELEDNIGMCAQGNLTRICNVLAGYMDGVVQNESLADKLGRLLPLLNTIEDVNERVKKAVEIMRENGVTRGEWADWINPLTEEDNAEELIAANE